jgi:mono/diheme cytochrome c family protein
MNWSRLGIAAAFGLFSVMGLSSPTFSDDGSARIFKAKCAVCHGAGGKGDSPAGKSMGVADLGKVAASKSDAELKAVIEKGKNKMPAYGKSLKPAEIDGLIAYIKSLK